MFSLILSLLLDWGAVLKLFEQPQFWGLVLGAVTPLAVSVLKQPGLSPGWKSFIAVTASVFVGIATVGTAGQLNTADLLTTVLLVYVASQAAYRKLWKPKGVSGRIERATTLGGSGRTDYDPNL